MNEQAFFHWDLIRPPLQSPAFSMGASLLDFSILELRKEKSRDAARSRRGKENYEFYELAKLLPLPAAITSQLDKASIIRLSISYLKLQEFASHGDPPWDRDGEHGKSIKNMARRRTVVGTALDSFEAHHGTHILQSLDGFAFALGNDGRFLYVSETVSIYLGLSQVEMTGSSVFDYVHNQDHQELAEILGLGFPSTNDGRATPNSSDDSSPPPPSRLSSSPPPEKVSIMLHDAKKGQERTFCLRMKSTLTKRGVHVRTSGYRVVCVIGHMRPQLAFTATSGKENLDILGFVGLAIALPPPTVTELRIERDTFIMRLSPEFKIIYCDTLISQLMEWTSEEMSSYSFYDYCHPGDLKHLQSSHYDLISKGQILTNYFRLLNKGGGYVWVQMCATTLFSSKTSEEHTTLAIIYVLSGIERRTCAMIQSEKPGIKNALQTKTPCQKKEEDKEKKIEMSEESHSDSANADDHILQKADKSDGNASASHVTSTVGEVTSTVSTNIQEEMVASKAQPGPKFSRRKMEKPRKRKKECEDSDMENMIFSSKNEKTTNTLDQNSIEFHLDSLCQKQDNSHDLTGSHSSPKSTFSASPEDLSVTNNFPKNGNFINSSMTIATNENRVQNQSPSNHVSLWKTSVDKANLQNNNLSPSSVKDLENMVKHLPRNGESYFKQVSENEMNNLRLPAVNGQVSKNRTSHWRAGNSNDMTDPHPASNLLRTLYANRESVIRSSISRPQCFNPAPCDMVDSIDMLTPPANEDAIKEPLTLSIPQINLQGRDKALTPNVYNNNNNNNNNLHVSVINKGIADSYNITPPSSVSPEDKQLSFMDSSYELNSSNNHHHHCHNESSLRSPSFSKSMTFPQTASSGIHNDFAACSNKFTNGMTSSYQPIPSYQHHIYNGGMNPVVVYDKRSEMWYPLSYSS